MYDLFNGVFEFDFQDEDSVTTQVVRCKLNILSPIEDPCRIYSLTPDKYFVILFTEDPFDQSYSISYKNTLIAFLSKVCHKFCILTDRFVAIQTYPVFQEGMIKVPDHPQYIEVDILNKDMAVVNYKPITHEEIEIIKKGEVLQWREIASDGYLSAYNRFKAWV